LDINILALIFINTPPTRARFLILVLLIATLTNSVSSSSVFDGKEVKFISKTSNKHSLGLIYMFTTVYLGMKPNEHEFKVMGLAPYAKGEMILRVKKIFDEMIWLNKNTLQFETSSDISSILSFLHQELKPYRFDYVAAAIQLKTEELLTEFVKVAISKTKIRNLALVGGVFMNIKANMLISN
ncbi:unnamed protein product, partial [marine sediment metagenome]